MPSAELYHGDNLDVFPLLEDESVDTVITDSPYGYFFMGKSWDHGVPGVRYWAECLRVAKPGAMLCAFGGTRTHHRLMCAIEDAGWEIRDCMMLFWNYGSGFPKSHSIGKAIDKTRHDDVRPACRFLRAAIDASEETVKTLASKFGFHPRMVEHWAARDTDSQPTVPKWDQWIQLKALLSFGDRMDAEVWRLNGRKGKPGDAWYKRKVIAPGVPKGKSKGIYGDFAEDEYNYTAPATAAATLWDGYGTALKPAYEPIILAMKPLPGTFAQNALDYGVAGIWVDGCRVGTDDNLNGGQYSGSIRDDGNCYGVHKNLAPELYQHPSGRWPANLLLSHAPGCECVGVRKVKGSTESPQTGKRQMEGWGMRGNGAKPGYASPDGTETISDWICTASCPVRMLDEQSGERPSGSGIKAPVGNLAGNGITHGRMAIARENKGIGGDTGGASRFFTRFHYSAKASRSERELGLLGHIPCLKCGLLDSVTHMNATTGKEEKCRRNGHPTVKPLDVCRWLCRLTKTPTGGVVLDPFMGSGRIPMAAILEGRDTIGIELERPSFEIAQAAVRWAEEQVPEMVQGELEYA